VEEKSVADGVAGKETGSGDAKNAEDGWCIAVLIELVEGNALVSSGIRQVSFIDCKQKAGTILSFSEGGCEVGTM
jgi:hypothetical protein